MKDEFERVRKKEQRTKAEEKQMGERKIKTEFE
jgi:hypothetical protein